MEDSEVSYSTSTSPEGIQELNGKDASYRNAPMISAARTVLKRRIRGALVPFRRLE